MRKKSYFIIILLIVVLIVSTIVSIVIQPDGTIYQGLCQILSGILGGVIALIGVNWTLKLQQQQNAKEWERQLDLTRKEWSRQDSHYREDWRMKVLPWFELQQNREQRIMNFSIVENIGLDSDYQKPTDFMINYGLFTIKNTGKDAAFIVGIRMECPHGSCLMAPFEQLRLLEGMAVTIDLQQINFYLRKGEDCTLTLIFKDLFENTYVSKILMEINTTLPFARETTEDGIEHSIRRLRAKCISNPSLY